MRISDWSSDVCSSDLYIALMSTGLTKADIEAAVDAARGRKGPQIELRDLRFRAGERSAKWSLMVGLHTGERSRIPLGSWPALSINDARAAAREDRRKEIGRAHV